VALPKVPTHSLAPGVAGTAPPSLALPMPTPAAPKPGAAVGGGNAPASAERMVILAGAEVLVR